MWVYARDIIRTHSRDSTLTLQNQLESQMDNEMKTVSFFKGLMGMSCWLLARSQGMEKGTESTRGRRSGMAKIMEAT